MKTVPLASFQHQLRAYAKLAHEDGELFLMAMLNEAADIIDSDGKIIRSYSDMVDDLRHVVRAAKDWHEAYCHLAYTVGGSDHASALNDFDVKRLVFTSLLSKAIV